MPTTTCHPGPDNDVPAIHHADIRPGAHSPSRPVQAARMLSAVQLTGAVLAIPVALGSAYSVYRANFSPEVHCQALRADIIAMIDRNIDARTRRMLVRRDVETFQKACGDFDPDARAAFSTLLVAVPRDVAEVPVTPNAETALRKSAPQPAQKSESDVARTDAAKIAPVSRPKEATPNSASEPVRIAKGAGEGDLDQAAAAAGDARWLDAVRGALSAHAPSTPQEAVPATAITTSLSAPALPPAVTVQGPLPSPSRLVDDPDRPVPPAAIPDSEARAPRASWISHIPFVGEVLDRQKF